jgi:hypothetical protein
MKKQGLILFASCIFLLTFCVNIYAFKLPDTGQSACYTGVSPWGTTSCTGPAGTAQDADYTINPMSYTDNSNGTITDNNTSLMWQKCTAGYTDVNACTGGAAGTYNWYQANGTINEFRNPSGSFIDVCGNLDLGGHTDWRLPTKKELITLVNYNIQNPGPTINPSAFPNTKSNRYWTSNVVVGEPGNWWIVYFTDGSVRGNIPEDIYYVRCVRGAKISQGFTLNGTATDTRTGLEWQVDEPGVMTWAEALTYCKNHGSDWRLPNIKELESLSDDLRSSPGINTNYFPYANHDYPNYYWSSTTNVFNKYYAWIVVFSSPYVYWDTKTESHYVRCVKGGGCANKFVRTIDPSGEYDSIQQAYDATNSPQTITAREASLIEPLDFAGDKIISLIGGYDCEFSSNSGFTTISGSVTIGGTSRITLDKVIIR